MFAPLLETVRGLASGERALESVAALSGFHRVQSSPGYDAAAAWLAREIERIGLVPEVESVPGDGSTRFLGALMPEGWECTGATAVLWNGNERRVLCDYSAVRLSLVLRSAPARGRHRIVALDDGTEDAHYRDLDVRGAIVLTRGPVHRVHRLAVVERGAAGLLTDGRRLLPPVRNDADDRDSIAYTSFWWNGDESRGFGFVVSPDQGQALRARLAAGEALELEVAVDSRRFPTTIPLLSTRITNGAEREVLIVAHLCHPQPSANDNASGVAAALETARVLACLAKDGRLRGTAAGVRILWVPELTGTYAWLGRDPERARRIVAALNLDMVGQNQERCGSTFLLEHPPCFAASFAEELLARIRSQAVDWVQSYSGPGHYSLTRMAEVPYSGGSDHAVFNDPAIGIPCPMLIQWPDRYYHSSLDTVENTDPGSLALAVRCAATYAAFLADASDAGRDWLAEAVARGTRRRTLAALDAPDPDRALARARSAGESALASLSRLGMAPDRVAASRTAFREFVEREAGGARAPLAASDAESEARARIPRRRIAAPLESQRHLIAGSAPDARDIAEAWRRLDALIPDAHTAFEIAWYACDGSRTLGEIEDLVALELGAGTAPAVAAFFDHTARLGLSEWTPSPEGAWITSARATATR